MHSELNIRFNDEHSSEDLIKLIKYTLEKCSGNFTLDYRVSGESFLTKPSDYINYVKDAILEETGLETELSTSGGTSDARFLKDIAPICELGLKNKTAHKVDECVDLNELESLYRIYSSIIRKLDNI